MPPAGSRGGRAQSWRREVVGCRSGAAFSTTNSPGSSAEGRGGSALPARSRGLLPPGTAAASERARGARRLGAPGRVLGFFNRERNGSARQHGSAPAAVGAHAFSPPRRSVRPAGRGVWGGSSPGTRSVGAPQSPTCDRAAPPAVPVCPPGVEQRGPCSPRGQLPPPAPCSPPPLPNFTGAPRGAAGASRGAHGHSPPGDAHPFSWGGGGGHPSNTCWAAPGKFKQPKKVSLGAGGALIFRQIPAPTSCSDHRGTDPSVRGRKLGAAPGVPTPSIRTGAVPVALRGRQVAPWSRRRWRRRQERG